MLTFTVEWRSQQNARIAASNVLVAAREPDLLKIRLDVFQLAIFLHLQLIRHLALHQVRPCCVDLSFIGSSGIEKVSESLCERFPRLRSGVRGLLARAGKTPKSWAKGRLFVVQCKGMECILDVCVVQSQLWCHGAVQANIKTYTCSGKGCENRIHQCLGMGGAQQ